MLSYLMHHLRLVFVCVSIIMSLVPTLVLAWRAHARKSVRERDGSGAASGALSPAAWAGGDRPLTVAIINQPTDHVVPPNVYSSIAIWNYEVARRLATECRTVVYSRDLPGFTQTTVHEGVEYRRVPIRPDRVLVKLLRMTAWMRPRRRPYLVSRFYYAHYARHVAEDLKRINADVVHVPNFPQFLPILRAKNPNIRIVLHMHCNWLCEFSPTMLKRRLMDADLITTCSEYVTRQVREVFPQYADRCHTMYNGVDATVFNNASRTNEGREQANELLYVGRISPEKGVHVLLDAFQRVLAKAPDAMLTLVGPDEVQPPDIYIRFSRDPKVLGLKRFYDGQNYGRRLQHGLIGVLASKVRFVGAAPHGELPKYYEKADVFLFPSVWQEPFGIAVIEAQAAGVPVVSTRSGGVVESVQDKVSGLLVERDDAAEMAEAILTLMGDAALRERLARSARTSVMEKFSWQSVRDNVLRSYRAIPPRDPKGGPKRAAASTKAKPTVAA